MPQAELKLIASYLKSIDDEDIDTKIKSIIALPEIFRLLKEAGRQEEIIPLIQSIPNDDEEISMVLLISIKEIRSDTESEELVAKFLPVLTSMALTHGSPAKESANLLESIISEMSLELLEKEVVNLFERLISGKFDSEKLLFCQLLPVVWGGSKGELFQKHNLKTYFSDLTEEKNPLVRKEAIICLKKLFSKTNEISTKNELLLKYEKFFVDTQERIKCTAVQILPEILSMIGKDHFFDCGSSISSFTERIIGTVFSDPSWAIRKELAKIFYKLPEYLTEEAINGSFLETFLSFLVDSDKEVSLSGIKILPEITEKLTEESITDNIIPSIDSLFCNSDDKLKNELAKKILPLLHNLESDQLRKYIVPLTSSIFESSPEVVMSFVFSLKDYNKIEEIEIIFDELKNAISTLSSCKDWRKRREMAKILVCLVEIMGESIIGEDVLMLLEIFLRDRVSAVRIQAGQTAKELISSLSPNLIELTLLPGIVKLSTEKKFSLRLSAANAACRIAESEKINVIKSCLFDLVGVLANDQTVNVREMAVNCYEAMGESLLEVDDRERARKELESMSLDVKPKVRLEAVPVGDSLINLE